MESRKRSKTSAAQGTLAAGAADGAADRWQIGRHSSRGLGGLAGTHTLPARAWSVLHFKRNHRPSNPSSATCECCCMWHVGKRAQNVLLAALVAQSGCERPCRPVDVLGFIHAHLGKVKRAAPFPLGHHRRWRRRQAGQAPSPSGSRPLLCPECLARWQFDASQ